MFGKKDKKEINDKEEQVDKKKSEKKEQEKKGFWESFFAYDNIKSLIILIVIILAFRWSVVSPYKVPTHSMEPTIKVGDRLLANKLAYSFKFPFTHFVLFSWSQPKRGDIIVFRNPQDTNIDYVKRVIGVAGDELQIKDDILYINGKAQQRVKMNDDVNRAILDDIEDDKDIKILYQETIDDKTFWVMYNESNYRHSPKSNWPPSGEPYKVPADSIFAMGDNRDDSLDSRFWGEVPLSYVRGKAMFVIWSKYMQNPEGSSFVKFRFNRIGHWLK